MRRAFPSLHVLVIVALYALLCGPLITVAAQQPSQTADSETDMAMESAAAEAADQFTYSPRGRRDPFKPLITKEPIVAEIVKKQRPQRVKGPMEKFELDQYRLIAIMVVSDQPRAMVKAPDGKSYTVEVGEYIGMNNGIVTDIQTKDVVIDESGQRIERSPDRIVIEEVGIDSRTGEEVTENRYIVM